MKSLKSKPLLMVLLLISSSFVNSAKNRSVFPDSLTEDILSEFTLARSEGNVSIYTRWLKVNESRSTRQLKAVMVVNSTVENVLSVITCEKSCMHWMRSTKEYCRLKTVSTNEWYSYIQFSVPWPLDNQDCILKYQIESCSNSETVIGFYGMPDFFAPKRGIERISHMEGKWVITELGSSKCKIEYYVFSKQAPKFPTWITDPIIQKNLIKTMKGLGCFVEKGSN